MKRNTLSQSILWTIAGLCGSLKTLEAIKLITGKSKLPVEFPQIKRFVMSCNGTEQAIEFKQRLVEYTLLHNVKVNFQLITSKEDLGNVKSLIVDALKTHSDDDTPYVLICCYHSVIALTNQSIFNDYIVLFDDMSSWCPTFEITLDNDLKMDDHFIIGDDKVPMLTDYAIDNRNTYGGQAKLSFYNTVADLIMDTNNWTVRLMTADKFSATFVSEPKFGAFPKYMIMISANVRENIELKAYLSEYGDRVLQVPTHVLPSRNKSHDSANIRFVAVTDREKRNTLHLRKTHPELYVQGFRESIASYISADEDCLLLHNATNFDVKELGRKFDTLPFNNEGLNQFRKHRNLVIQSSWNYSPTAINYYGDKGISSDDLHTNRTIFKYYQSIMRMVLRAEDGFDGLVTIVVFTRKDAEELKKLFFPNAQIIVGSSVVFPKKVLGAPKKEEAASRADRDKKAAMVKLAKKGYYGSLDGLRITSICNRLKGIAAIMELRKLTVWKNCGNNGKKGE